MNIRFKSVVMKENQSFMFMFLSRLKRSVSVLVLVERYITKTLLKIPFYVCYSQACTSRGLIIEEYCLRSSEA